jgi:hypothetical protein
VTNPDQATSEPPAEGQEGPDVKGILEQIMRPPHEGSSDAVSCPAGWYWDEPNQQCVPYMHGFDFWDVTIEDWLTQTHVECPPGTNWTAEENCCMPEAEFSWPCNNGYMTPNGVCQGYMDICVDAPLIFPQCIITPTPTQPPPAQTTCKNPSKYTTQPDCVANNCKWVSYVTRAGGYCTYP